MGNRLGWDVSNWQRPPLPPFTYGFLFAKASEGTNFADPTHAGWRLRTRKAGKLFGSYHFARPNTGNSAISEAEWFVKCANPQPGELVALDIEVDGPDLGVWVGAWCQRVTQLTGANPIVYTNLSVGDTIHGQGMRPLWMADPSSPKGSPRLPAGWTTWLVHQFGTVGGVDRDMLNGTDLGLLRRHAVPTPGQPHPLSVPVGVQRARLIARIGVLLRRLRRLG